MYITDEFVDRLIKEDVPYLDLTTHILDIGNCSGIMQFYSREQAVLCGTEEVLKVFKKLDVQVTHYLPSGTLLEPDSIFLEAEGSAENLHLAWKVSLNILENCSGIATRTRRMLILARTRNDSINLVATRKIFPGTKELAVKALLTGGGYPHRLGLSETVLVFKQHINFLGGLDNFITGLDLIKAKACEKKVIIETDNLPDALKLCAAGVDGIQFDKVPYKDLNEYVEKIKGINPTVVLLAAGGINESNVEDYAGTGVDAIVTTSVYFGKPVDMGVKILKTDLV